MPLPKSTCPQFDPTNSQITLDPNKRNYPAICSILGMNLFGCKFCKMDENWLGQPIKRCERKNFDSLLWALTTVFQVNLHG
jgi:hypothetical protein